MAVPLQQVAARPQPGLAPVTSAYREYRPAPAAARAVACTWQGVPGWPRQIRLLPDGCVDLVWDGQHARVFRPAPRQVRRPVAESALVTGIRFRPGWAGVIMATSIRDLPDIADLADVWDPAAVQRIEAALAGAATPAASRAVLNHAAATRFTDAAAPDPRVLLAVSILGQQRVLAGDAARGAGLSSRQIRRRFDDQVGLPPKTLQTILRFQRLRRWLATPRPAPPTLARAAADCGYYDQAHLCRDCARLAGVTPAALLAASASREPKTNRTSATPASSG